MSKGSFGGTKSTVVEEGPKKSKKELDEEKATKETVDEITLRIRDRDGTITDEESELLDQINEKNAETETQKRLGKA